MGTEDAHAVPARASSPPSCRQPPSACSLVWRWGAEPRGVNKHLVNSLRLSASLCIAMPCSRTAVSSASLKGGRRPALGTRRGWLPSPDHGWVWDRAAQRPGLPAAAAALRLGRALQGDHSGTCRTPGEPALCPGLRGVGAGPWHRHVRLPGTAGPRPQCRPGRGPFPGDNAVCAHTWTCHRSRTQRREHRGCGRSPSPRGRRSAQWPHQAQPAPK